MNRCQCWIGHTLRKPVNNITRQTCLWNPWDNNKIMEGDIKTQGEENQRQMITIGRWGGHGQSFRNDKGYNCIDMNWLKTYDPLKDKRQQKKIGDCGISVFQPSIFFSISCSLIKTWVKTFTLSVFVSVVEIPSHILCSFIYSP